MFQRMIFSKQINGMSQRVGYPDGLDRNITDLERTYAHVLDETH